MTFPFNVNKVALIKGDTLVWVKFIFCIVIIFFSGRRVARYGNIIAGKTGLGGVWIGLILLALVTSLPELFTGISAIILVGVPDLTIGNLFGANAFNLLNLALLDIVYHNGWLLRAVSPTQRQTGWFSLALVVVAAVSIFVSSRFSTMGIGWIGWYTPVIILSYLVFMRIILRSERRQSRQQEAEVDYGEMPLGRVYLYFAVSAAFIIGAGIWLAIIGGEIAGVTGWGASFVGSLFLAFTTSLPEITVSLAAMRMGAVDLAVANMIGSNLFNMTIIGIDDLVYLKGPVLSAVSESNLLIALVVMVMTLVFIIGLHFKPRRFFRLSWWNCALIGLFLSGAYFSFILA